MNVVIANSVGIDENGYYIVHSPSRWSLGVKNFTDCIYYPWELAYLSSFLKKELPEYSIKLVDGILNRKNVEDYIEEIKRLNPDLLIMEPSARTFREDIKITAYFRNKLGTPIIFVGGLAAGEPELLAEYADYVCLGEYEYTILELFKTKFNKKDIKGLYPNGYRNVLDIDTLPFPEDEDVSRIKYFEPNCEYKEIQFYTSRGCPMKCNFCVAGNLYYKKPNWRPRKIKNIISEIKYLRDKYPEMEGLFFDEEVHNISKEFIFELCTALIKNKLNYLKIDAMCEYYLLDYEILEKMKQAGYYKLRIGIETASDKIAEKMSLGPKFNLNKLYSVLEFAKDIGIKMYGTFTIGGLGSNSIEDSKTIDLLYRLISENYLYDLQISVNTPQPGTPFYKLCKEKGYLITDNWNDYDGGNGSVVSYPDYSKSEIDSVYIKALNKYDDGLKKRAYQNKFDRVIENKIFDMVADSSKLLLIRSYRIWLVEIIADIISKQRETFDLFCQNDVKKQLGNYNINKFYVYGSGFINVNNISKNIINDIKNYKYDLIIIPVRNIKIKNYINVLDLVLNLNAKKLILVDSFGNIKLVEEQP